MKPEIRQVHPSTVFPSRKRVTKHDITAPFADNARMSDRTSSMGRFRASAMSASSCSP